MSTEREWSISPTGTGARRALCPGTGGEDMVLHPGPMAALGTAQVLVPCMGTGAASSTCGQPAASLLLPAVAPGKQPCGSSHGTAVAPGQMAKASTATMGTYPVPAPLLSPGELQEVLGPMGFALGALEVSLYALSQDKKFLAEKDVLSNVPFFSTQKKQ